MSVYSGFVTRNLQFAYDTALSNIISTLLVRLAKFYKNETVNESQFFRIISQQQKYLRKMEARKYLQPKYADLLMQFHKHCEQSPVTNSRNQPTFNRTFSVLDRELKGLQQAAEIEEPHQNQQRHISIDKKVRRKRKKTHNKISLKSNIDIWDIRQQKMPELPSLHGTRNNSFEVKFKSTKALKVEPVQHEMSKGYSKGGEDIQQLQRMTIHKAPKFRSKMFFK